VDPGVFTIRLDDGVPGVPRLVEFFDELRALGRGRANG